MSDDLQARLKAAQAERARIAAAHSERRELEALQRAVAAEEQAAKDDAGIAEAEIKHARIEVVRTELGAIVLHRPDSLVYKRFQDLDLKKINREEIYRVVRSALAYPDAGRLDSMLETLPGALGACSNAAARLAGVRDEDIAGKA